MWLVNGYWRCQLFLQLSLILVLGKPKEITWLQLTYYNWLVKAWSKKALIIGIATLLKAPMSQVLLAIDNDYHTHQIERQQRKRSSRLVEPIHHLWKVSDRNEYNLLMSNKFVNTKLTYFVHNPGTPWTEMGSWWEHRWCPQGAKIFFDHTFSRGMIITSEFLNTHFLHNQAPSWLSPSQRDPTIAVLRPSATWGLMFHIQTQLARSCKLVFTCPTSSITPA